MAVHLGLVFPKGSAVFFFVYNESKKSFLAEKANLLSFDKEIISLDVHGRISF